MKSQILNVLKYILFLAVGIVLFYYVYKGLDTESLLNHLSSIKWGWIWLSFALGILSHVSRAIRWNMLIEPLGYKTNTFRTFCSVMAMYFTNLIIPRGGELARCTLLSRTEKIPFSTLAGTVVVERSIDTLLLLILVLVTLFLQIDVFNQFITNNPDFGLKIGFLLSPWFWIVLILFGILALFTLWRLRNHIRQIKFLKPIFNLLQTFFIGIKSILKLKNRGWFIFHSLFIFAMYFLMMYVLFFSFGPTNHMTMVAGLTAFVMGGLAMLAPVQAGVGAWHFMVFETLAIYGLDKTDGKVFALICHTSTNLMILVVGLICLIYLTILGRKSKLAAKN